jgi:hypothetical protein
LFIVLLTLTAAIHAEEMPAVVPVRVPAARVNGFFPAGSELRGMSAESFEALIKAAREASARANRRVAPRLLRAEHHARWESGLLVGHTELVIEPAESGPADLVLAPWTPAIAGPGAPMDLVRARDDGRTVIRIDSKKTTTIGLDWQLQARSGPGGRGFTLGVPEIDAGTLVLDLPVGLIPDGPPGLRQGPTPGSAPDRRSWRFDGRGGLIDLQLRDENQRGERATDSSIWLSGPTRIDLVEGEPSANWRTDWLVEPAPRGARRFSFELDPGLELVDVSGPAVNDFEVEPRGATTRVTVRLSDDVKGATRVSVKALASAPFEGPWTVPAARPLDAHWTGGTTTIRLGQARLLSDCRERFGRRVLAGPLGTEKDFRVVMFEASAPRPVAELVFRRPSTDVSAEVNGQVIFGTAAPRLKSRVTCRVHRGRLLGLNLDLPAAWLPDRIAIAGTNDAIPWHPEIQPEGSVRVHTDLGSLDPARKEIVLELDATATIAGGRGETILPRVRPVGVRVNDETWVAWTESGVTLRPISAHGLAWIDPRLIPDAPILESRTAAEAQRALAWRWTADVAHAQVERERVEPPPSASVHTHVTVDLDRIRLESQVSIRTREERLRSIAFAWSEPIADNARWSFTEGSSGQELTRRRLDARQREAMGFPETAEAWELLLPYPRRGELMLRGTLEGPWAGHGRLPLLVFPSPIRLHGTVLVEVDRRVHSTSESAGLVRLDPTVTARLFARSALPDSETEWEPVSTNYRRAHAFSYTSVTDRFDLQTESLSPAATAGMIRAAILTTHADPASGSDRNSLRLEIDVETARALELRLPTNAKLARVLRDGQPIKPVIASAGLSVELPRGAASGTCAVVLDYLTTRDPSNGTMTIAPELPTVNMPCISFIWELITPRSFAVAGVGPGLSSADPAPEPSWMRRLFGSSRPFWMVRRSSSLSEREAAMIQSLDQRTTGARGVETTLGELLTRWDGVSGPMVIDSMALSSAGIGPRTRMSATRQGNAGQGAASVVLQSVGLAVVPLGGSLLITTRAEAPNERGGPLRDGDNRIAWAAAFRQASAWGSDVTDRFQSVARWRGAPTRTVSASAPAADSFVAESRRVWRFVAPGWPAPNSAVTLTDGRERIAWGWVAGLIVVVGTFAGRRFSLARRAIGLAIVALVALVISVVNPSGASAVPAGLWHGAIAALIFSVAGSIPLRLRMRRRESRSTLSPTARSSGAALATSILIALATVNLAGTLSAEQGGASDPIVALFPYEGAPDVSVRPDRVVLRLRDYDRLQALTARADTATPSVLTATSASHHVRRLQGQDVEVESRIELIAPGRPGTSWTFPIENARAISATLDGIDVPVHVREGGTEASVAIDDGTRPRSLRIVRLVHVQRDESGEMMSLPINPIATSRIVVDADADATDPAVASPSARGRLRREGDRIEGLLGPVDRLVVHWPVRGGAGRFAPSTSVEGLFLWDAEPAGDRVRALLTYRNPQGIGVIRLGLEPGVAVRTVSIPGIVEVDRRGTAGALEWVATIDPPLRDGATVQLEFWKPSTVDERARNLAGAPAADGPRIIPRIEPLQTRRFTGMVAFRRPPNWSGRLESHEGSDPTTEEGFVRAWGTLPDDPLTLSGTARFTSIPAVSVQAGPRPRTLSLDASLTLRIEPGRIDAQFEARPRFASPERDHLDVQVPDDLRVVSVTGDGITDWSRPAPDRIAIRFDGGAATLRSVRIDGWVSVPSDPLGPPPAQRESRMAGFQALDVEPNPTRLEITSASPFQLERSPGVTLLKTEQSGNQAALQAAYRSTYQVERPDRPLVLRWDVEPPRSNVLIASQMTIEPESLEWTAVVRYDVLGGAVDAIHFRLPTEWAAHATVRLAGVDLRVSSEPQGEFTHWTIRPARPLWGSQRLLFRSSLALNRRGVIAFPELTPLGRGSADTFLSVVNSTGQDVVTESSPGLQTVESSVALARFRDEEFDASRGLPATAYRVIRDNWSLHLQPPAQAQSPEAAGESTRETFFDVSYVLAGDGSALGTAQLDIVAQPGVALPIALPADCPMLWASVNGSPVQLMRAGSGRWMIPLDRVELNRVAIIWRMAPGAPDGRTATLPLPAIEGIRPPNLISVRAPESVRLDGRQPALEASTRDRAELMRAAWLSHRITERLTRMDRTSTRDRQALAATLVELELALRSAERSVIWNLAGTPASRTERIPRVGEEAKLIRAAVLKSLSIHGLDDIAADVQTQVGLVPAAVPRGPTETRPGSDAPRVRRIGRPWYFELDEIDRTAVPAISWTNTHARADGTDGAAGWMFAVALVIPLGFAGAAMLTGRSRKGSLAALAVALVAVTACEGPLILPAALALAIAGRFLFVAPQPGARYPVPASGRTAELGSPA